MKNKLVTLILVLVILIFPSQAMAAEDAIPSIVIDVTLREDGSAVITEIWDVTNIRGGTELYKAMQNMEGMSVHSLVVRDETGAEYQAIDNWDTDLSLQEKAGKSGILKTDDGYELCWGIGSYGSHQYTIQYTLEGMVKNYSDYAAFNFNFLSDMSSPPQSFVVTIRYANTDLTADNARIWGYGFTGEVAIYNNGTLVAYSTDAMGSNDYVVLLCRFDTGLFPTVAYAGMTFDELKEAADNDVSGAAVLIVLGIIAVITVGIILMLVFFSGRYKLADGTVVRLPGKKHIEPDLSVPMNGSVPAVYAAMAMLHNKISTEYLMGAYLIQLQKSGCINIHKIQIEKKGKSKQEEAIEFIKQPQDYLENSLYMILSNAATDGVLTNDAIEKHADKLNERISEWAEDVNDAGSQELIEAGIAAKNDKDVLKYTATGFDQAVKMVGFQKYLESLRKPDNDYITAREYWDDYLVFSTLFGIGEQVLSGLKELDPEHFDEFSRYYGRDTYSMIHFMHMTNHLSSSSVVNVDGTGGSASSGGGGGFSGGGGGGTR